MSVLLRTIMAFPTGRMTSELLALVDAEFDPNRRVQAYAELTGLSEAGAILQGRDGRWRPFACARSPLGSPGATPGLSRKEDAAVLRAVPALFQSVAPDVAVSADDPAPAPDPVALLRYYRSALQADCRGAIEQAPGHHGAQWHLISGSGPLAAEEDECLRISIALDQLSEDFRAVLAGRIAKERSIAIGWPIAVGERNGAAAVWPVGLLNARWRLTATHLELTVERDDLLVNPAWLDSVAKSTGTTEAALRAFFPQTEDTGLPEAEFLSRLNEVMGTALRPGLNGLALGSNLDPSDTGIHDMAGLFLPDDMLNAQAVRDLDEIAAWPAERLARTALASLLGVKGGAETRPVPVINTQALNREQILAVRHAVGHGLTVVTTPPGTGKGRVIASMVASVVAAGGSVLVASRNPQTLDALEQRFAGLAPDVPFMVRVEDAGQPEFSFPGVLADLATRAMPSAPATDPADWLKLAALSQRRLEALDRDDEAGRLHGVIGDVLERIEARLQAGLHAPRPDAARRKDGGSFGKPLPIEEGAPLLALTRRLAMLRIDLARLAPAGDHVALTEEIGNFARDILPRWLASRAAVQEADRSRLALEQENPTLGSGAGMSSALLREVVSHRPLWLSPLSALSRHVPLVDGLFGLVIIDEASQCDIASALPLLARAKRAVILGDARQHAFTSRLGPGLDQSLMQAQGPPLSGMGRHAQSRCSLYDLATQTPGAERVLLRDQHWSAAVIVAHVSAEFYDGQLRVAADHRAMRAPRGIEPGLAWTDVPAPAAPMTANVNLAEVAAIVAHLRLLMEEQDYEGSIGIIAPFRAQAQAISAAIAATVPAELVAKACLHVGTVESSEGLERDLTLYSPCLGHASTMAAVAFMQRDWRRLNRTLGRAQTVVHVFGDLAYARSGLVSGLQRLALAATEPRVRLSPKPFATLWERRMFDALKSAGLNPRPQYEIAGRRMDFALFGLGYIKLALEIDGRALPGESNGYRKRADHWRDKQLESLGWRVQRFWVDELATDLEACIERVRKQLS